MSRPAFLLRPEPGWSASAAAARSIGLKVEGEPLAEVESVGWRVPEQRFDGLLVGSANVFRHGGRLLEELHDLPVHCVGETTADAARENGFTVETVGHGGLANVLNSLAGRALKLLRPCGEARIALETPPGIEVTDAVVYRLRHLPIPPALARELGRGGVVLLHSAELARHFGEECERLGLSRCCPLQAMAGAPSTSPTAQTMPLCWPWRHKCVVRSGKGGPMHFGAGASKGQQRGIASGPE